MAPLRIAILMENTQFADVACVDMLGGCSTQYISATSDEFGFGHLLPYATDMEFLYLSSDKKPAFLTPSFMCNPTHTYEEAPRDVDIVLIAGPSLSSRPAGSLTYMRDVCADEKPKTIMSVCTGSLWLADSGVLKGVNATTNRGAISAARKMLPDVQWLDQRWVVDERDHLKFWTAGGAGAGIDMLCTYIKERFHEKIAMAAWDALDFDPTIRGQFYSRTLLDWSMDVKEQA